MPLKDFENLLAPFPVARFLEEIRGKQWLHIEASPDKVGTLLDWGGLNRLMNMEVWNHQNFLMVLDTKPVPGQAFCRQKVDRTGQPQMVPVPAIVQQYLDRGASLVLNEVETLEPAIRGLVDAFAEGLGAKSSGNAYVSQQNHQAFDTHFDRTDVFAIQTLGSKRWRIYEGQLDTPVIHARFTGMPPAEIQRLKGKVEAEVVTKPGDVLYLPRGRFHDALATEGPSIHLSFAVSEPKGLDFLQIVMDEAVGESKFREDLPLAEADLPAYFDQLADRLREVARSQRAKERGSLLRRQFVPPRPNFHMGKGSGNGR
ncbi:MAG TPA: cupin domain-containing protein [Alphaproteobacteria bacterium]|nr:cupin domain-containing protein [Alphaproteobacteria bacterium]